MRPSSDSLQGGGRGPKRGLHVALLGIDGIGKSTLAQEVKEAADACGEWAEVISWRRLVEENLGVVPFDGTALSQLRRLWVDSFRLYFSGASAGDLPVRLPTSLAELDAFGGTEYLTGTSIDHIQSSGPFAASWIELAANALMHTEVIRSLVARGCLVIQESFGYKHVLKELLFSTLLSHEMEGQNRAAEQFTRAFFGRYLHPDLGILIAGDPALAWKWRTQQESQIGIFEMYASEANDPQTSFLKMQSALTDAFESFANAFGWVRIEVRDVARRHNRRQILHVLRGTVLGERLHLPSV